MLRNCITFVAQLHHVIKSENNFNNIRSPGTNSPNLNGPSSSLLKQGAHSDPDAVRCLYTTYIFVAAKAYNLMEEQ